MTVEAYPEQERFHQAVGILGELVRSDPRFAVGLRILQERYPDHMPLTPERLAEGVPFDLVWDLFGLARYLGVGSLPSAAFFIIHLLIGRGSNHTPISAEVNGTGHAPERQGSAALASPSPKLERSVGWFYARFRHRRSPVAIGYVDGYSSETVERGIAEARKLFKIKNRRGRSLKRDFAP